MMKRPIGLYRNGFNQMTTVKQLRDWDRKKYASISRTIETRTDRTNEYIFPRERPLEDILPPLPSPRAARRFFHLHDLPTFFPQLHHDHLARWHRHSMFRYRNTNATINQKHLSDPVPETLRLSLYPPLGSSVNRPLRDVDTTTFCSSSSSNSSSRS